MGDYQNLQFRCQRGGSSLASANNLLAECYAALGRLIAENNRLKRLALIAEAAEKRT